ncbi:MAG: eukaryotic-like serine/threonine-protein kinase [Actinomycetota bacterium]|nr:eukaryotic-like serine/threonine-protein kinase [Actinomycetota bacterium]
MQGGMDATDQKRTIGGRYRLDRSIGAGGMGTVWEGYDELLGRPVAVKEVRFPPELGDREVADLRERTMREARATARLSHPNVVTTYDVVEEDDRPWIVMELLKTHSLSEVLRDEGPLPPHRVAEIGLGVLAALETAHAQGVVHRDVKPSNVLVTTDGRPVLTDFGIATMAGDPALTSTGVVLGSPAYMSPERARGKAFGPESDLWSLGVTLFAAAEGRPPFESDNALGTLTAVISDPVPPMMVGGPLALAVGGLLRKDPHERASIATVRKQLQEAAADRTTEAAAPLAGTVALDQAGRTEALPAAGVGSAAPRPAAPTPPPEGTTTYGDDGRRRSGLLVAALVVGLLLIGAIVAFALLPGGDGDKNTADPKTTPSTSAPATSSSPPARSTSAPPPSDDGVPAGYQLYEDPSGFSLAVPDGWHAEQSSATAVDIKAPDGLSFLRVDQTDQPKDDAKKAWEEQEKSVKKDLPDYHRISIETVDYNGWDAADWEFTFGSNTHVLNRGFVTDSTHGYALYLSTPEDQWASSQDVFQTAADTFTPAE